VNDTAYLHLVASNASTLVEEGRSYGTLPGRARVRLTILGTTIKARFTVYVSGGSISGAGHGVLHIGRGSQASFGGVLAITRGTGRYAHARGSGGLYGTLDRSSDGAVVQTLGHLSY
jgi:hypothetical protein